MIRPLNPKQFHSRIWGVVLVLALLLTFLCSNLYSIQYTNGRSMPPRRWPEWPRSRTSPPAGG